MKTQTNLNDILQYDFARRCGRERVAEVLEFRNYFLSKMKKPETNATDGSQYLEESEKEDEYQLLNLWKM